MPVESWPGKAAQAEPWTLIAALARRQRGATAEAVNATFGMGSVTTAVPLFASSSAKIIGANALRAVRILAPISLYGLPCRGLTRKRRGRSKLEVTAFPGRGVGEVPLRSALFSDEARARCNRGAIEVQ